MTTFQELADRADLRALGVQLIAMGGALNGKEGQAILKAVGTKLVPLGNAAVRADIGDSSMSGWAKNDVLRADVRVKASSVSITPFGPQTGRWRVLTDGRGNRAQGPGVSANGTTKRNKNGTVKKARAYKGRGNGSTRGKGTWTDTEAAMERLAPDLMEAGLVTKIEVMIRG